MKTSNFHCTLTLIAKPSGKRLARCGSFGLYCPSDVCLAVILSSPVDSTCCWFCHWGTIDSDILYLCGVSQFLLTAFSLCHYFQFKVEIVGMTTSTGHDFFKLRNALTKSLWWSFTTKHSTSWDMHIKLKLDQLVFIALEISNVSWEGILYLSIDLLEVWFFLLCSCKCATFFPFVKKVDMTVIRNRN